MGGLLAKKSPHDPKLHLIQHHFTSHERLLLTQHLQDFASYRPARPKDIKCIACHWDQLNIVHDQPIDETTGIAPATQLFDIFYRYLFESVPNAHPLYHQSTKFKGRALMNIISGIRNLLQTPDVLEAAAGIAHRHVAYGVRCEHFNPFGVALMRTLETLAPTLWTPQVSDAWHRVYAHVAVLVLERLESKPPAPPLILGPSLASKPLTDQEAAALAQKYPAKDVINPIAILYTPRGRPTTTDSSTRVNAPPLDVQYRVKRLSLASSPEKPTAVHPCAATSASTFLTKLQRDDRTSVTDIEDSLHTS